MADSVSPNLLIASPQMRDPFFEKTVVLVWHHDEDGALGVVVNRPMEHQLEDILSLDDDLDLTDYDTPVLWGGPVEKNSGTVVTRGDVDLGDEGWMLPTGLGVTRSHDALLRLLRDRTPLMLCLGYSGWEAGQLDREIEQGGWLFTDCDAAILFETPIEDRYAHALATLGLTASMVWMQPVHE